MDFIPVSEANLAGREREYVLDCVESGWISSKGKYVDLFEKEFARRLGVRHAVGVCNGTAALHAALAALGIGPGDEVIVPSLTFISTANAVVYTGARPVFVDSEPRTWNMDPAQAEAAVTPRTRAIVPVHLYGHPCDMDPILAVARRKGLAVVEDAAEALGTSYKGRPAGAMGALGIFSFYGNKTITTGEGGMVVTNDDRLAARAQILKGQGMTPDRSYFFEMVGYNYRMTNIQAAIGLAQVEQMDGFIRRKREVAAEYARQLREVRGIALPVEESYGVHGYWMYSILVEPGFPMDRDALMARLLEKGIETRRFFYPCHTLPPYAAHEHLKLPVAEDLGRRGVSLPTSTRLTFDQIRRVADAIRDLAG